MKKFRRFMSILRPDDEDGQNLVEYALVLGMITIVCIAALGRMGEHTRGFYTNLASSLSSVS